MPFKKRASTFLFLLFLTGALQAGSGKPDSLLVAFKKAGDDAVKFKAALSLGAEYRATKIDSALYYHQLCLTLAKEKLGITEQMDAENQLAFDHIKKNDLKTGYPALKDLNGRMLKRSMEERAPDKLNYILTQNYEYLGLALRKKDSLYEAIHYFEKAIALARDNQELDLLSEIYNNTAQTFYMLGSYPKSLEYCLEGLKVNEKRKDKQGIASSTGNAGILFKELGDYKKALEYFISALEMNKELDNKRSVAINYGNIGVAYDHLGMNELAFEFYSKAAKMHEEMGSKEGLVYNFNNIGLVYDKDKKHEKAIEYFNRSLEFAKELNDNYTYAHTCIYIGSSYNSLKKYALAQEFLTKGFEVCKRLNAIDLLQEFYQAQSELYNSTGQYEKALDSYKKYISFRDSIVNEENLRSSIQLESNFKYEKKLSEDSVLHAKEKQISQAELDKKTAELKADRNLQYGLYGGLGLLLIFMTVLYNRFAITKKQKNIIHSQKELVEMKIRETETQKKLVEEKQKEIIDSINYAKRIQFTLLAHDGILKKNLQEHFVIFKPKDIVSGDFYWATEHYDHHKKEKHFYLAVCDSTGHGVPGAFMGLMNTSFLNEAVSEKEILEPSKVFDHVRLRLIRSLAHEGRQDGMDGILVRFTEGSGQLTYAASNNQPLVVRDGQLIELDYDKMPIGRSDTQENFRELSFQFKKGDMLYLYTDGYADQFGGDKGKKLKEAHLKKLLLGIYQKSAEQQKQILETEFDQWRGHLDQVDDVCVVGIRI